MSKPFCLILALLFLSNGSLLAGQSPQPQTSKPPQPQSPPTPATAQDEDEEGVVRIGTSLVQFDAVVTDRNGKIVRDLTADDFEIFEGKTRQNLTNFSFIDLSTPKGRKDPTSAPRANGISPSLTPAQVGKTIVVIVDDQALRPEDVSPVRTALKNFITTQVGPNDLVALIRTHSGSGTLQQLTTDRKLFLAGIERIYPRTSFGFSDPAQFNAELALKGALRSLKDLPGRKSIVLFSYGFPTQPAVEDEGNRDRANPNGNQSPPTGELVLPTSVEGNSSTTKIQSGRTVWDYQRLTDQAARASVTIYPVDMGGLRTLNYDASVQSPESTRNPSAFLDQQRKSFRDPQDGLLTLARETGGIPFINTNGFKEAFQRVIEDQSGYYLLAYSPEETAFVSQSNGTRQYRKITVKVKRPGLTVRTRQGFLGVTDTEIKRSETPESRLVSSLVSPFQTADVNVRLTPLFLAESQPTGKQIGMVRSLLFFDARDLTFSDNGDGWKKAEVGLFAMMFDDNGDLLKKVGQNQTLRLRGKTYEAALRNGFVFTLDLPVEKSGTVHIRAAVRDNTTQKIGSASQVLETPKLEKDRISLSGLILYGLESKALPNASPQLELSEAPSASPAVREFVRGGGLSVSCYVYNAVSHPQTKQPAVTAQIKLLRDGKEIYSGKEFSVSLTPNGMLEITRAIALADSMESGEYTAVVSVTDLYQSDSKRKTATQTLEFTLVSASGK
jgi:VWFA-related protein